jgi:hypothetical protein
LKMNESFIVTLYFHVTGSPLRVCGGDGDRVMNKVVRKWDPI